MPRVNLRPHRHHRQRWRWPERFAMDPGVVVVLCCLTATSFVGLWMSADRSVDVMLRQTLHVLLGWLALLIATQVPMSWLQRAAPLAYLLNVLLLLAVPLIGTSGNGAQRWLSLGGFYLQPSELMKLTLPWMLAYSMAQADTPPTMKQLGRSLACVALPCVFILHQPDLGTTMLLLLISTPMLMCSGIPWRWVRNGGLAMLACLPILWHIMHPYQRQRVLTFLNPQADPLGSGYHIIQSKIAIGSGGFWGRGLWQGSQTHGQFLPENTTDFIFSAWCEAFGWVGALFVCGLLAFLTWRLLTLAEHATTPFQRYLTVGIAMTCFVSAWVNVAMVTGLLPVVGVPLPMMSYGGSHLLTTLGSMGVALGAHRQRALLPT